MKKVLTSLAALSLALVAVLVLASCGGGVSVSKLESTLKEVDESLTLTESSSGVYTASTNYEYTVNTNGSKVKSVKIEMPGTASTLKSESALKTSLSKSASKMTRADLAVGYCVLMAGKLRIAVGGSSPTQEETISFFSSQTPWTVGSWTIKAEYSGSNLILSADLK